MILNAKHLILIIVIIQQRLLIDVLTMQLANILTIVLKRLVLGAVILATPRQEIVVLILVRDIMNVAGLGSIVWDLPVLRILPCAVNIVIMICFLINVKILHFVMGNLGMVTVLKIVAILIRVTILHFVMDITTMDTAPLILVMFVSTMLM